MTPHATGRAEIDIDRPTAQVFAAVADITRMGEWSPEATAGRWVGGGEALGGRFEGDNEVTIGPLTLKRWTTTSEITGYDPPRLFEFVAEGVTTWRFEFTETAAGTRVVETFSYPPVPGVKKVLYNALGSRRKAMERGMAETLARLKASLEA